MDAVYPLKKSKWEDAIRYSARGLQKFGVGADRIFLVGYQPKLFEYGTRIIHIPHEEKAGVPVQVRIWEKLLRVCLDERISDEFLLMNDDFFFLKEFVVRDVPFFHRGSLEEIGYLKKQTDSPYRQRVVDTLLFLRRRGFPDFHYGIHTPIRIEKKKFIETYKFFREFDEFENLLPRLCYGNFQQLGGVKMSDFKIRSVAELENMDESRFVFSTADEAENDNLGEFLKRIYPEKPGAEKMKILFQSKTTENLFVTDEDNEASLDKRYKKPELLDVADEIKAKFAEDNTKKELISAILKKAFNPERKLRVRVICEGTLGPRLLKKNDVTDDPQYVKLLKTQGSRRLVEAVK